VDARVLASSDFAASKLKMAYAAWTKISAALLLAARGAAAEMGLEDDLVREWSLSQPELDGRYQRALVDARAKGWRWQEEMRQISSTLSDAGQPGTFGNAAAEIFARYPSEGE
jgi:hypothetical protein